MPGSAGGGHSGGGHVGGGFSGGGGMHTGGMHTGGMHTGMPMGGFHHNGFNNPNDHNNFNNFNNGRRSTNKGCNPVGLIMIAVFLFAGIFGISMLNRSSGGFSFPGNENDFSIVQDDNIETLTPAYRRLAEYLCSPYDGSLVDASDVSFLSSKDIKEMDEVSHRFHELTGVEPYLIILHDLDGEVDADYDRVNDYLYDKYVELFGEDEGHILFLFITDGDEYYSWYINGNDVEDVFSSYLSETVLDNIDNYLAYDIENNFKDAYTKGLLNTIDEVMNIHVKFTPSELTDYSITKLEENDDYISDIPVREPFLAEYNTRFAKEDLINCDVDNFFDNDSEQAITSSRIDQSFTKQTGVQPYILLTKQLETEIINDPKQINPILKSNYESIFTDDSHIFFIISLREKEPIVKYYVGPGARFTLDSDACDTVSNIIFNSFRKNGNTPEALASAFEKAADVIMYVFHDHNIEIEDGSIAVEVSSEPDFSYDNEIIGDADRPFVGVNLSFIVFPAIIIILIIVFAVLRKRKSVHTDENYDNHQQEADHEEKAGYKGLENEFPVTCKSCGATAYLTEDGCCQYCGTKIK